MSEIEQARKYLQECELFFDIEDVEEVPALAQTLNMNDVWGWACADCERVPDEDLVELARLHKTYGWCGVLYYVSEKRKGSKSEFADINRFVEFVRNEEKIIKEVPSSTARAYHKVQYTIGENS